MACWSHPIPAYKGRSLYIRKFCELVVKPFVAWNRQWKLASEISKHYKSGLSVFQEPVYQHTTMWNSQNLVTSYKEQAGNIKFCRAGSFYNLGDPQKK